MFGSNRSYSEGHAWVVEGYTYSDWQEVMIRHCPDREDEEIEGDRGQTCYLYFNLGGSSDKYDGYYLVKQKSMDDIDPEGKGFIYNRDMTIIKNIK